LSGKGVIHGSTYVKAPRQIAEKPICGIFICRKKFPKFADNFICRNIYLRKYLFADICHFPVVTIKSRVTREYIDFLIGRRL
jgi:hypothetical protein